MKINQLMHIQKVLIVCVLFFVGFTVNSNNLLINNLSFDSPDTTNGTINVLFDLSWENSWKTDSGAMNWDAAWVFVKYRVGTGDWKHAKLSANSIDHSAIDGIVEAVIDSVGVFIYSEMDQSDDVAYDGVSLKWLYNKQEITPTTVFEVKVFGIEMVYVPEGSFWLGDGASVGTLRSVAENAPIQITTAPAIVKSNNATYDDDKLKGDGILVDGDEGIDTSGTTSVNNLSYPTGYKAFYCMKYEINKQQYTDFLNLITETQSIARLNIGSNNKIIGSYPNLKVTNPSVACGHISWSDGLAYSDWCGLRPITELEIEKVCRGPLYPVAGEYAWGTSEIYMQRYNVINSGLENSYINNSGKNIGNANYANTAYDTSSLNYVTGVLRGGVFAASAVNKTREETGATYYGVMEMSGNVYEFCIVFGNVNGRKFTGTHGDGVISLEGYANQNSWIGQNVNGTSDGFGFKLGCASSPKEQLKVSHRSHASYSYHGRNNIYGFHLVRSK